MVWIWPEKIITSIKIRWRKAKQIVLWKIIYVDNKWKATEDRRKLTLFLDSHVTAFPDKFQHITNSLQELKFARVLAAVGVILGSHLIEPFIYLTSSSKTTWSVLQVAFPTLYSDLTTVKIELLLDLTKPALKFISEERFKSCLYTAELLEPTWTVEVRDEQKWDHQTTQYYIIKASCRMGQTKRGTFWFWWSRWRRIKNECVWGTWINRSWKWLPSTILIQREV